jgi:site-specific DNA-methyltransferase (adenine-specific)/modification methylase
MIEINRIYNESNCDTLGRMEKGSVDVVFTSPPYNRERNDKYDHYDDRIKDYFGFLTNIIDESLRVARKNVFFNIMPNYYNRADVYKIIGHYANQLTNIFIWEKSNPLPAQGFNITNAYEFVLAFGKLKSNKTYTKNHITTSVAIMDKTHKAVMHEDVANFFIANFTQEGDLVYDPFMGTGTTAVACRRLNRNYVGSEIIKEYCDIAERRLKIITDSPDLFNEAT